MSVLATKGRPKKGRPVDVAARLETLQRVLEHGGDRLEPAAREHAEQVVRRTGERLRLGLDHTVVAFAGATGSGKSSLFNAIAGVDVSKVGVTRPTTSHATGLVIGSGGDQLLDWLGVPRRHRVDAGGDGITALDGLVLLDLPDHDSTAVAHRLEVDRLVKLVDLLVWVVDPQKYADDALHSGYLQPMKAHAAVMSVALNQIDRLAPEAVQPCVTDLKRLLAEDGLGAVPVVAVSARTGQGLDDLRRQVLTAVDAHEAVRRRVAADLDHAVDQLQASVADRELDPDKVPGSAHLVEALSIAAGINHVADAAAGDYRRAAGLHTGWPVTRWVAKLRRSPLDRLRLGRGASAGRGELEAGRVDRSSLPAAGSGQQAQVAIATREIAGQCGVGLPTRWQDAVSAAAVPPGPDVADALDRAVTRTSLVFRKPLWWTVVGLLQVVLVVAALVGGGWLGVLALLDYFRLPELATPTVWLIQPEKFGVPLPTVLAIGGLFGGLLLAIAAGPLVALGAARRRRKALKALRASVAQVGTALVLEPVARVLAEHRRTRTELAALTKGR